MILCLNALIVMFSPLIMPPDAYLEMVNNYAMPLPIPKPQDVPRSDLRYMSFEEAMLQPISDEYQPSLQNRRRDNNLIVGYAIVVNREPSSFESEQSKKL